MSLKYSANAIQLIFLTRITRWPWTAVISTKQHKILNPEGKDYFVSHMHKAWIPKDDQQCMSQWEINISEQQVVIHVD